MMTFPPKVKTNHNFDVKLLIIMTSLDFDVDVLSYLRDLHKTTRTICTLVIKSALNCIS